MMSLVVLFHILWSIFIPKPLEPYYLWWEWVIGFIQRYLLLDIYMRSILEVMLFMVIAGLVELKTLAIDPSAFGISSFIFSVTVTVLFHIFLIFSFIHFCRFKWSHWAHEGKFRALYEGIKPGFLSMFYNTYFILRWLLLAYTIVLVDSPLV